MERLPWAAAAGGRGGSLRAHLESRGPPTPYRASKKPAPAFSPGSLPLPYLIYRDKLRNLLSLGPESRARGEPALQGNHSQGNAWRVAVAASWDSTSPFAGTHSTSSACRAHASQRHGAALPELHPCSQAAATGRLGKIEQGKRKTGRLKAPAEHCMAAQPAKLRPAASPWLPA